MFCTLYGIIFTQLRRMSLVWLTRPALNTGLSSFSVLYFYARKQLLLLTRLSYRNSVCPSVRLCVRLSVCHTGGSVKNGLS